MEPDNLKPYITVKDHSVSKEIFTIFHDTELDLLYTHPQPAASELSKYYESDDYISHTDGNRTLFEKAYQLIKSRALKMKVRLIGRENQTTGSLLDIGAGTGDFIVAARTAGWNCTGIEPSEKARAIAVNKDVQFANTTLDLADESFDVITMWHVLEHVPDVMAQLKELRRLIKPSGTIVIAVPNFKSFDAIHYDAFWAAYDVPRHLWHFSKTAVSKLADRNSLVLDKIVPMKFDAFYVSLLSEKYKSGKMNYLAALITGLRSNSYGRRKGEYSSHIYVLKPSKIEISAAGELKAFQLSYE